MTSTPPVFLAGPGLLDGYGAGDRYVLEGAEARHAGVVQRRRPGERVDVADGAGVRLECVVEGVAPGRLELAVLDRSEEPAPAVRLALAQALAKGDRDERAIEAATELGVDVVVPWRANRSVVVWRGDRAAKSRARWAATVREATKQSRRARTPEIADPVDSKGLALVVRRTVADGGAALVLHGPAGQALADVGLDGAREVLVVVGPEGGIAEDELALLTAAGARPVRLGPHVLRTSTAGPAALAVLGVRLGRWG